MSKAKAEALRRAELELELDVEIALAEAGIEPSEPIAVVERRRKLEAQGWRAWYGEIFGMSFINALEDWHAEALEWHWDARMALKRGETPDYDAMFAPWPREFMKTTCARRLAVCDAAISGRGYCLYVGGTQKKVASHALSIGKLLESKKLLEYYPLLGQIETTERGQSKGDRQEFRFTKHGYVFHFVSLDTGVAGSNVEDQRVTLILPDDIDERTDSPAVSERRLETFTTSVLPMGDATTLFFFAQNLIHDHSIATKILRNEVRVLTNRKPVKPIPAVYDLVTEERTVDGIVKDIYISGRPSWKFFGPDRIQKAFDAEGLIAFKKERQHEVDADKKGLVLPEYNERVHVITWAQFEAVFGTRQIPADWKKFIGHDWGNVHPCVVSAMAVSSVRSKRPGLHFLFAGIEAPSNSMEDDVAQLMINRFFPKISTQGLHQLDPEAIAKYQTGKLGDLLNAPRELAQKTVGKQVGEYLNKDASWQIWNMSHEQKRRCEVYNAVYGLPFRQVNPGADGGVDEMRRLMRVDYKEPHLFKPGEMGYCQFYLVVDDDQYYKEGAGGLVTKARDDRGLKLWREQIPRWRRPERKLTELGLQTDTKPIKLNDDTGNSLMMIYVEVGVPDVGRLTKDEKVEIQLPEEYKAAKIPELMQVGGAGAWHAYQDTKAEVARDIGVREFTGKPTRRGTVPKNLREMRRDKRGR